MLLGSPLHSNVNLPKIKILIPARGFEGQTVDSSMGNYTQYTAAIVSIQAKSITSF